MSSHLPDWPHYFMNLAQVVKSRGNCMLRQVGVVLVKDKRIIATGYNGTPHGLKNCLDGGCLRCLKKSQNKIRTGEEKGTCLCVHAEVNAILQSAYHGVSTKGAVMYTTLFPCLLCAKEIMNAGIISIYYSSIDSGDEESLALLSDSFENITHLVSK